MEETNNQELDMGVGGDSGEHEEELDVEESSWDGLLIEDNDEEASIRKSSYHLISLAGH